MSGLIKVWLVLLPILVLQGCASYKQQTEPARQALLVQDWAAAEQALLRDLDGERREKILLNLELGMLRHLAGDYQGSHGLFEQAKADAEAAQTISVTEELRVLLTSPRQRIYRPQTFERLFVEYIQTLNFIALSEAAAHSSDPSRSSNSANVAQQREALNNARVMVRQMEIQLNDLAAQVLDYQAAAEQRETPFYRLLAILRLLNGDLFDRSEYVLRDNAWLRYVTGMIYEQRGEWSAARVAYQQAAELYEQGYREQMGLSDQATQQAWFDTLRMMKRLNQPDWQGLAAQKLSEPQQQQLQAWQPDWVELVQLAHQGWIPQRGEMNAMLIVNHRTQNMEVYPIILAPGDEGLAQSIWFYLMYTDKGLARLALNIYQDGLRGIVRGAIGSKTLFLGPIWPQVQAVGLDRAAQTPLRVTLPYYDLLAWPQPTKLQWRLNEQAVTGVMMDAPAIQAVQAQLLAANEDFYAALARAMLKRLGVQAVTQDNAWLRLLGDIATSATEAAETRNWQTLPAYIHLQRYWVEPGLVTWVDVDGQTQQRELSAGERWWLPIAHQQ